MDVQNKNTVKALNQLLQGEHMAVEVFEKFIDKTDTQSVRRTFMEAQKTHRENINRLDRHISELGEKPKHGVGVMGKIGEFKLNVELIGKKDSSQLIEKAIEGVYKGINMAEKITRGELDNSSRLLVGKILKKDRSNLIKLQNLH